MKKASILGIFALVFFLSGCSLGQSGTGTTTDGETVKFTTSSVWKSTDGGETWTALGDSKINLAKIDVLSLALDPEDPERILLGLKEGGILETKNGGVSWAHLRFEAEKVYGLSIDPADSRTIIASGVWQDRGKIWKSFDGGENWEELYTAPAPGPVVVALAVDPTDSRNIYASTSEGQVMKSIDEGKTWRKIFSASSPVNRLAMSPSNGSRIFLVGSGGKLYRSLDGGRNIEDISKNLSDSLGSSSDFYVVRVDGWGNVYLGGSKGLVRSSDQGNSWQEIPTLNDPSDFPIRALDISSLNSSELAFGSAKASYRSLNGGDTWATSQFDISKIITNLQYFPTDPSIIYLSASSIK